MTDDRFCLRGRGKRSNGMAGRLIFPRIMALLILAILGSSIVHATAAGARMIQITDMAGRKGSIPARVKRIVPLGGAMRFVVYMQGLDA
ncbi:hypothetical protein L6248_01065, partial [Candidatus Parcubacteria bacterium]|nr:hypothetical protein [Candidatus Parcubacteria bacterium]